MSTVYGGRSLNLGWTGEDDPALVIENRRLFAGAVAGEPAGRVITLRQVHGTTILVVRDGDGPFDTVEGRALLEGDGLMTDRGGTLLGIQTADCVPVMVIDPAKRAVAVFHAGWRGTVAGIVAAGVAKMTEEYGSAPGGLLAAVGPSIGACCYTVGDEVRGAFSERFGYAERLFQGVGLGLWEANRMQLLAAGLSADSITVVGSALDVLGTRLETGSTFHTAWTTESQAG